MTRQQTYHLIRTQFSHTPLFYTWNAHLENYKLLRNDMFVFVFMQWNRCSCPVQMNIVAENVGSFFGTNDTANRSRAGRCDGGTSQRFYIAPRWFSHVFSTHIRTMSLHLSFQFQYAVPMHISIKAAWHAAPGVCCTSTLLIRIYDSRGVSPTPENKHTHKHGPAVDVEIDVSLLHATWHRHGQCLKGTA